MTQTNPSISLTRRLIVKLSVVVGLVSLIGSAAMAIYIARVEQRNLEAGADNTIEHLAKVLEKPLWDLDVDAVRAIGESFSGDARNSGFVCMDARGGELYSFRRADIGDSIRRRAPIVHGQETIGLAELFISKQPYHQAVWRVVQTAIAINALILVTVFLVAGFIVRAQLRKPLNRLAQLVEAYAENESLPAEAHIPYLEFKPFESVLLAMGNRVVTHLNDLRTVSAQLERRNAELAESNELQQMIFDQTFQFIGLLSPSGVVRRANRTALAFAEAEEEAVLGKLFWETPWWRHDAAQQARLQDAVQRAAAGEVVRFETTHLDANGNVHAVDFSIKPVRDANGAIVWLIPEGRDITEIHQAETALRESETRYRTLYENAGDAIVILKQDSFLDCNEKALELYGCTREQLIEQTPYRFSPPTQPDGRESRAKAIEKVAAALAGEAQSFEWVHVRYDGTPFEAEVSLNAIRMNEGVFIQAIVRDITARKRAESQREELQSQLRQAQKMEAIGTLAGGIAHDFNNILGAILGHAQLLQLGAEQGKPLDGSSLEEILRAAYRAKNLVRQILTFSRRSEASKDPVRLDLIVKEALKLLRGALPAIIEIKQQVEPLHGTVLADATHMHQVVMNLCTNAAQAMGEQGGVLEVRVNATELAEVEPRPLLGLPAGAYAELTVSDTGCGIAPENLEHIFEPFFTTKEQGEGTGLGLSVVHGIVEDHGGGISVESEVGRRTMFRILLPLVVNHAEGGAFTEKEYAKLPRGDERILVVDDEEPLLHVASKMLAALGYEVVLRNRAAAAHSLVAGEREHFDLIITDLMMPHMTGIELRERLAEAGAGIPMLLATGYSDKITPEKARELGFENVLQKPLSIEELAVSVRRVLDEED